MKKIETLLKNTLLNVLLIISIVEGICSIWATLSIPADSKKSFLFGLSTSRLAIVLVLLIGIGCLILLLVKSKLINKWCSNHFTSDKTNRIVTGLGILFIFIIWVTICTPTKNFFPFEAVFIRLKPSLVWIDLFFLQVIIYLKISKNSFSVNNTHNQLGKKTVGGIFILLTGIWVFITTTKIGLVEKTAFWNVPGIPLSMIQFISLLLFVFLVLIFFSNNKDQKIRSLPKFIQVLIPILLFFITLYTWGSTPMLKHFFSLQPTPPNFQPYPYSDARIHDLGAVSVLKGEGIYFHGYTDKPLYMVFLAVLHLFAGNDYAALSWAQICVLSLIPVLLYLFGKKFQSPLFGIVLSAIIIIQQRNSILLSYNVASANPKLFVSEELMYLGIVLVTYLLFKWMRKPELKVILLLGGILGALSLVRMNPVFIIPAVLIVIFVIFRRKPKVFFKHSLLFGIGFLLVFSPWLFVGVNSAGQSWFFIKIQDIIVNRYPFSKQISAAGNLSEQTNIKLAKISESNISYVMNATYKQNDQEGFVHTDLLSNDTPDKVEKNLVFIMVNHFFHNFSTSLLALPDSITINNLSDLTQREYWRDENTWPGNFSPIQYLLIIINLFILSIGFAESWKKYHLAGLAPLIIFLAYDVSLSVALNSGSRYIVPINWILFFYYALGIIFICKRILNLLKIETSVEPSVISSTQELEHSNSKKSIILYFVFLIFIAAIVPVANLVVPVLVPHNQVDVANVVNMIPASQNGDQKFYGDILYPYYENDNKSISFDFVSNQVINSYKIEKEYLVDTERVLESDLPAVLSFSTDEDKQQLDAIYLIEQNKPYLFWQKAK